jgi:hypothetical protein
VDRADFNGFMTSGFSVKKGQKPYSRNGKYRFWQLITRRSWGVVKTTDENSDLSVKKNPQIEDLCPTICGFLLGR